MKLRVPAEPTEAEFQEQLLELCHLLGYRVAHFRPAQTSKGWRTPVGADGKGWPDLAIVGNGRVIFAELKVGANRLTDEQEQWLELLTKNGELAFCWYPSMWDEIVEVLSRRVK